MTLETASIQIRLQPNRRARRWILKIDPDHGPSLTIPGCEITPEIRTILIRHEAWLLEKLAELQTRHWLTPPFNEVIGHDGGTVPIALPSANNYQPDEWRRAMLTRARELLPQRLEQMLARLDHQLGPDHGLQVTRLSLRRMRSRWGSCGANGRITLNTQLIFLPVRLQQHVILHELCHLQHMNHSRAFWSLLEKLDPDTPQHRQAMRNARSFIPAWA